MIVICKNDFPIGVLPGATEEQAEAFTKKMRADSDAAISDPRQVRPVFHWHDVPEMKACDLSDNEGVQAGEVWNRERIEAVASRVEQAGDKEAADLIRDLLEAGIEAEQERITQQPAVVDVVQVPRKLINDLLAALQGRRGDLHFRLAVLAAAQQQGGAE